jgi:hypothetical protein
VRTAGSGCGQAEGASRRNRNWFQEKGSQFGESHSQHGARRSGKPTGYEKNISTYALPSSSTSSRAGGITLAHSLLGAVARGVAVFQFPDCA